jgi:nucleotide-binding universal stress UspA family protein
MVRKHYGEMAQAAPAMAEPDGAFSSGDSTTSIPMTGGGAGSPMPRAAPPIGRQDIDPERGHFSDGEPAGRLQPSPSAMPQPERHAMPYIVLVGLDLSEPGGRAWRFAFDLAELRGEETEIHAVVVGAHDVAPAFRDVATPSASSASSLSTGAKRLPPLKVLQHRSACGKARLMAMHYRTGRPEREIVKLAKELGADLVVVPTEPASRWKRLLGGTVADKIARSAPCPVVVVRPKKGEDEGDAELFY